MQHNTPILNTLLKYISHTDYPLGPFFPLPISYPQSLDHLLSQNCPFTLV